MYQAMSILRIEKCSQVYVHRRIAIWVASRMGNAAADKSTAKSTRKLQSQLPYYQYNHGHFLGQQPEANIQAFIKEVQGLERDNPRNVKLLTTPSDDQLSVLDCPKDGLAASTGAWIAFHPWDYMSHQFFFYASPVVGASYESAVF